MNSQDNHRYDDIIGLPHPTSSSHPRMPLHDRAAQFSPFSALTGHDEAIGETVRQTDEELLLSEDVVSGLNEKLNRIMATMGTQRMVKITYFVPDKKKAVGAYVTCSDFVKKIDRYAHTVMMTDQTIIPIVQISDIEGKMFGDMY